jgi:phage terminase large subunit-like protein
MIPQVTIKANPHPGQREVHNSAARFRVLSAGRRWGKTRLGVNECIDVAAHGGRSWWIAPTYKMSEVGWRPLRRMAGKIGAEIRKVDRQIVLPNGGEVTVRSADNPDSLRGEGLDFVVLDEFAYMQPDAWIEAIRPALSDRQGKALFISTPRGRNFFWELYQRGISGEHDYASFQFPTVANPYIAPSEVEAARRELPELIFRQEYLAEFIDDQGSVFRRIQEAATLTPLTAPEAGRQYIAGVDVASAVDYTVVSVMDVERKHLVYMDRFNRVDYNVLIDRLAALSRRWDLGVMKIEANSIGQPVIDQLRHTGVSVIPFTTTSATKQVIIQNLQSAFENAQIAIIDDKVLIGELLSFESKRNASGSFSYAAPEGMHDDTVMSLAIAWDAIASRVQVVSDPFAGW